MHGWHFDTFTQEQEHTLEANSGIPFRYHHHLPGRSDYRHADYPLPRCRQSMSLHARYHDWARLLHASGTFHMHHKHVNTLDLPGRMLDGIIYMLKHVSMLIEVFQSGVKLGSPVSFQHCARLPAGYVNSRHLSEGWSYACCCCRPVDVCPKQKQSQRPGHLHRVQLQGQELLSQR